MKQVTENFLTDFFQRNTHLKMAEADILHAINILLNAYRKGNKVMICGNGGSASDSEHIVGELMKGFLLKRPVENEDREKLVDCCGREMGEHISNHLQGSLPAISLVSHTALSTAFCNDVDPQMTFAQQVYGYKQPGDVVIGISTSGNSKNVCYALNVAKAFDLETISMTGCKDSRMSKISAVTIRSPERETYRIQEDHLKIYHLFCGAVELELFEN